MEFLKRLPYANQGKLAILIEEMSDEHVSWWQSHIQPHISADPRRADRSWDWSWNYTFCESFPHQEMKGYAICDAYRPRVVYCMLILAEAYPAPPELFFEREPSKNVFVWYVAAAPKESLLHLQLTPPSMIGRAALDIAVVRSLNIGGGGRIWLHADPEGGDSLFRWYESLGMRAIPTGTPLQQRGRRLSDGRYFVMGETEAKRFLASHDALRS